MVNLLYAVASFTCALVAFILPIKIRSELKKGKATERAFLILINWTGFFCVADGLWGIAASDIFMNDTVLFIFSILFHLLAALTPACWLGFVLVYLGNTRKRIYMAITTAIAAIEVVMLIMNVFNKSLFYVDSSGAYASAPLRRLLFYLQYATYIFIAIISFINLLRERSGKDKESTGQHNHLAVLLFVAFPIVCGIFQMIYPDAPAYSIGYTLGICVIYSFVITEIIKTQLLETAKAEMENKAKTTFLFNMSHDIRTPMNAIIGFTNIGINHYEEPERALDCFNKIRVSGQHLLNLINDILEMSRIESGTIELSSEETDLRTLIDDVSLMNQSLAMSKDIDYTMNVGEIKNPYVYIDQLHFNEVIINLISNAIKYTKEGGKVQFSAEQISDVKDGKAMFRFSVKDNGIGISEEFQEHLFESFTREKNSEVSKEQGAGLGLSIVKKIVTLAGGTIKVESKPGEGSTFTVEVPVNVMEEKEIEKFVREINNRKKAAREVTLEGIRVLLAEDNELNREIASEILAEAGVIVETASDGEMAVRKVKEKGADYYDLILMDIQMPVMNGYEAAGNIRRLPYGGDIPIIALSANAFEEDKQKSIAAGMNAHIAKPINTKELLDTMSEFS